VAVYVSDLRDRALVDLYARPLGRLDDLVAAPVGADPPLVRGLLVRRRLDTVFLPIDAVALLDAPLSRVVMVDAPAALRPLRRGDDVLLVREVLGRRMIDRRAQQIVRARDVALDDDTGWWEVTGVETSAGAALRRLLPRALRPPAVADGGLRPWANLALLPHHMPRGMRRARERRVCDGNDAEGEP